MAIPIFLAALVHLEVFDLAQRPGQWIHILSYPVVIILSIPVVARYGRERVGLRVPESG